MTGKNDDNEKVRDAAMRFEIFAGRLIDSGMKTEDAIAGLLAATINATSATLDQQQRKRFAKWLRQWARAVERGRLDPGKFDA